MPLWRRRPASFYVDLRLREVFTAPTRYHLENRFLPELYTDGWGDYYGVFVWHNQKVQPSDAERRALVVQMFLSIVPTLLLVGGWLALLWQSFVGGGLRRTPDGSSPRCCRWRGSQGCSISRSATRPLTAT